MESKSHYIYEGIVKGRSYYGYTSRAPSKRWEEHETAAKEGKDGKFYNAIRKYGVPEWNIIKEFDSEIPALFEEIRLIHENKAQQTGWNTSPGGEGFNYIIQKTDREDGSVHLQINRRSRNG